MTISGIVLLESSKMPRYVWRDDPELDELKKPQRLERIDRKIEIEPFIKPLRLFRYKDMP